jgi:hypothetical protein
MNKSGRDGISQQSLRFGVIAVTRSPAHAKKLRHLTEHMKSVWVPAMLSADPRGGLNPLFEPAAKLIAGESPPEWLVHHLCNWAATITLGVAVEEIQPGTTAMRAKLKAVEGAALITLSAVADPVVLEFLGLPSLARVAERAKVERILSNIARRASEAHDSPQLAGSNGAKAGRRKALPREAVPARMLCAVVIAEVWAHLRGASRFRAKDLYAAADAYWRACRGDYEGWGDSRLSGWRPYFEDMHSPKIASLREECRRHLAEARHRIEILNGMKPSQFRHDLVP